jgi:uncharacterized protein (DUF2147 family)
MKKLCLLVLISMATFTSQAQSVIGLWKTIDDNTGEEKSHIQIYEENGKLYGKVVAFLRKTSDPNSVCSKCSDSRKGQKIMNMIIIKDMFLKDGFYQGGKILDPEKGKEYGCKLWMQQGNNNILEVRGFLGGISALGRTQRWQRVIQ